MIYDSIYENLLDINNKFGAEKEFFDYNFLILPKDILFSYINLLQHLFKKIEMKKK